MHDTLYKFTSTTQMKVEDNRINDPMIMTEREFLADETERVKLQEERLHPKLRESESPKYNWWDSLTTGEMLQLKDMNWTFDMGMPPWL